MCGLQIFSFGRWYFPAIMLASLCFLAGCDPARDKDASITDAGPSDELTEEDIQAIRKSLPGVSEKCIDKVRAGGLMAYPVGVENCFEMDVPREWSGLWRNDFEGSLFCPVPETRCRFDEDYDSKNATIWLQVPRAGEWREKMMSLKYGGLYEITFRGRRTLNRGNFPGGGVFDHEMVIDEIMRLEEVEPPLAK
ncbi:MAG: hypothetical protein KDE55_05315 [Novosphingobium sp.]|nr:hypothetical protein [Novosphingobium sp.]